MGESLSFRDLVKRMDWEIQDKRALIELWTDEAINAPPNMIGIAFFQSLIRQAEWPDEFRAQMANPFQGNAGSDANTLFIFARGRGINPANPKFTTLGSLMYPTLFQFGTEGSHLTAALIVKYKLIVDPEELQRLADRFQVPFPATMAEEGVKVAKEEAAKFQVAVGPDFTWSGSDKEAELQGLFRPNPISLDVGFLMRAIAASSAVCRIEINGVAAGTGFLVAGDLVVTNYHVLGRSDAEVDTTALGVALRFGALTNEDAKVDTGQTATLDKLIPIVSRSPIEAHDFVVLRAGPSIKDCKGLKPVILQKTAPAERSNINIIHHSGGAGMSLQFSPNGISVVMVAQGKLQYASRTTGGSSGSPCFDDDFAVIAIHHAARSTVWGVAGEGILIEALYEHIQQYLSGGENE